MIPKSKPEDLSGALRIIADWFDNQAAQTNEDADFWDHSIRARALDEAADYIDELRKDKNWICPIKNLDCEQNCGGYGCGN
jgi:hypothetical protein